MTEQKFQSRKSLGVENMWEVMMGSVPHNLYSGHGG